MTGTPKLMGRDESKSIDALTLCDGHTQMLNTEIERQGLDTFVPREREQVEAHFSKWAEADGKRTIQNFNPHTESFMAMLQNATELVGPRIFNVNRGEGNRCMLCWLTADHRIHCHDNNCPIEDFDWWIANAVSDQKKFVMEQLS